MIAAKRTPLRKCTGCGEMKEKKSLLRVLLGTDGSISIDDTGKKNGRGAYICKSLTCLNKAIKTKGLERSLKTSVPADLYEKLKNEYEWTD